MAHGGSDQSAPKNFPDYEIIRELLFRNISGNDILLVAPTGIEPVS